MRKLNGITLVALIITIIVLFIIATVSIALVTNSGIIDKAKYAANKYSDEGIAELVNLARWKYEIEKVTNADKTELEFIQESLSKALGTKVIVTKMGKNYKVKIGDTNIAYKINADGIIKKYEEMAPTNVYAKLDDEGVLYLRATQTEGYNLYTGSSSIKANWNSTGTANEASVKKVIIEEKIAPQNTRRMFYNCINLTLIENMENFHTENVTNMSYMFYLCKSINNIDVSMWDTSKVTDMSGLFNRCRQVEVLDIDEFDTSNVTNMNGMFVECSKVKQLDVSGFDTTKVTNMSSMFSSCVSLEQLDVSGFDTSNVTNMSDMFYCCTNLKEIDVSNFNTSQVTKMSTMFNRCRNVEILDVSGFNTSQVINMSTMFYECSKVKQLDVSGFDTTKVTNMSGMFGACNSLIDLNMSNLFKIGNDTNFENMFDRFNIIKIKVKQNLAEKLKNKFLSFSDEHFIIVN